MAGRNERRSAHQKRFRTERRRNGQLIEGLESRVLMDATTTFGVASITSLTAGSSGTKPVALVQDGAGNLFGVTSGGGTNNYGTLFEIAAGTNQVLTLASFSRTTGFTPQGNIVRDADGNLWGVATNGGAKKRGTIWEYVAGSGVITAQWGFAGGTEGNHPTTGLVSDGNGNLWGTTFGGGKKNLSNVFEFTPATGASPAVYRSVATVGDNIHFNTLPAVNGDNVANASIGWSSPSKLVLAQGSIPGVGTNLLFVGANGAGTSNGRGNLYAINPAISSTGAVRIGAFNTGNTTHRANSGIAPIGALYYFGSASTNGTLLGETTYGGGNGVGTLFQAVLGPIANSKGVVTANAAITNIKGFDRTHGGHPTGQLVLEGSASNLTIYGTTASGGGKGVGELYRITQSDGVSGITLGASATPPAGIIINKATNFSFSNTTGANPIGGLSPIADASGTITGFYVPNATGGAAYDGTILKLQAGAPAPADHVQFASRPHNAAAGATFGGIALRVLTPGGTLDRGFTGNLTLSVASGPSGAAILGTATVKTGGASASLTAANGTLTVPVVGGSAVLSPGLVLEKSGTYTLAAMDPANPLTNGQSQSFVISATAPTQLLVALQPTGGTAGVALSPIVIEVADQFGNVVTRHASTVKLSVISGPGRISGGIANARNGTATFDAVKLSANGTYTLRASDGTLSAVDLASITLPPVS